MEENERMNVTVEAVEENEEEKEAVSVDAITVIDQDLIHLLATIAVRRDQKSRKWTPLYYGLVVVMFALAVYWIYTYYVTKTGTRGPVMIVLMIVMGAVLLRYLRTPPLAAAEARMRSFLGQRWHYRIDDEGIHMVDGDRESGFQWSDITCWWEESGYLLTEIAGQVIAIREDALEPEELEDLKGLCWVYLGEAKQEKAQEQAS